MQPVPDQLLSMLDRVEDFNRAIIGLPIPQTPTDVSPQRLAERHKHLVEEVQEYLEAGDLHTRADALVDLIYVAMGGLLDMGITPDAPFQVVHEANMRKVRGTTHRDNTYDAVKPEGWAPPDFSRYLTVTRDELDETLRRRGRELMCSMMSYRLGTPVSVEVFIPAGEEA